VSTITWDGLAAQWGTLEITPGSSVLLETGNLQYDLDANGWVVVAADLGNPVVREVVADAPVGDGTDDHTEFVGGRNLIMSLHLSEVGDRQEALDALAPFLDPKARVWLHVKTEKWRERRSILVRHSDLSAPWERPTHLEVSLGWRTVGSPFWQGEERTATAWPVEAMPGREYDLEFDREYPSAAGVGSAYIVQDGNRPAHWQARIFGPVTAPSLVRTHDNGTAAVAFQSGWSIAAGDYLQVDSETRTVLLNGSTGAPRYSFVDFSQTEWWRLLPGVNDVRLAAESYTSPAQAEITYRPAFL
jgi:hypothetical protein